MGVSFLRVPFLTILWEARKGGCGVFESSKRQSSKRFLGEYPKTKRSLFLADGPLLWGSMLVCRFQNQKKVSPCPSCPRFLSKPPAAPVVLGGFLRNSGGEANAKEGLL